MGKKSAFTLIELLVVVAAIALLMAILVPALSRARKQAKATVCRARLRQWGMVLALYAQDHEGRFPCDLNGTAGTWLLRGTLLALTNQDANAPQNSFFHFRTKDLARCPMATKSSPLYQNSVFHGSPPIGFGFPPMSLAGTVGPRYPAWVMWAPGPRFVGSYGMNRFLFQPGFSTVRSGPSASEREFLSRALDIFSLGNKASIPVVLDSGMPSGGPLAASDKPAASLNVSVSHAWPFCVSRHDDFVNGLFLDWSVRKIGLKELWKLRWSQEFDTSGPWTRAGGVQPQDWPPWMRTFREY
jgi:prepilin-type N-terminal cleavage/methylation domain-containing protein